MNQKCIYGKCEAFTSQLQDFIYFLRIKKILGSGITLHQFGKEHYVIVFPSHTDGVSMPQNDWKKDVIRWFRRFGFELKGLSSKDVDDLNILLQNQNLACIYELSNSEVRELQIGDSEKNIVCTIE